MAKTQLIDRLLATSQLTLCLAICCLGSGCMLVRGNNRPQSMPAPSVINAQARLDQVIDAVNRNSAAVRQLQTSRARLSIPGAPDLRTDIAIEQPRRLRMTADHALSAGKELDVGSNDEMFWLWMKRNPVAYYGRHDKVDSGLARNVLPMPPDWLIEGLGLVQFDKNAKHEGPRVSVPGRLDVRSTIPTPSGNLTKLTVIDDQKAWVLEQHIYDQQGQLVASAIASDHRYDGLNGVSLPHRVQIQFPNADSEFSFVLEVDNYVINHLTFDPASLWTMPQPKGYEYQDITLLSASNQPRERSIPLTNVRPHRPERQANLRRLPSFSRIR